MQQQQRMAQAGLNANAGMQMPGAMESLNVAAATAIALYEVTRPL